MGRGRKIMKQEVLLGGMQPGEGQKVMRVLALRGSNVIEVEDSQGRATLCKLPSKMIKVLWVKRGTFVIVDEGDRDVLEAKGSKVTGTVAQVLYEEHRRDLEKMDWWPVEFRSSVPKQEHPQAAAARAPAVSDEDEDDDDDGLPPLEMNSNRVEPVGDYVESDSDEGEE